MDKDKFLDWSIDDGMVVFISDYLDGEKYRKVFKVINCGINSQNSQIKRGTFGTGEKGKFKLKNICS